MSDRQKQIENNVRLLRNELEQLITFFEQSIDYYEMVYEFWNAKDVLGHITFWHESFAKNISDLGRGIKPKPLKGKLSEVNKKSIKTTKDASIENLIERLKDAQDTIEAFIFEDKINMIPYKKGSRDYSKKEHLEVVSNHIHKHLRDIQKIYGKTEKQN